VTSLGKRKQNVRNDTGGSDIKNSIPVESCRDDLFAKRLMAMLAGESNYARRGAIVELASIHH